MPDDEHQYPESEADREYPEGYQIGTCFADPDVKDGAQHCDKCGPCKVQAVHSRRQPELVFIDVRTRCYVGHHRYLYYYYAQQKCCEFFVFEDFSKPSECPQDPRVQPLIFRQGLCHEKGKDEYYPGYDSLHEKVCAPAEELVYLRAQKRCDDRPQNAEGLGHCKDRSLCRAGKLVFDDGGADCNHAPCAYGLEDADSDEEIDAC